MHATSGRPGIWSWSRNAQQRHDARLPRRARFRAIRVHGDRPGVIPGGHAAGRLVESVAARCRACHDSPPDSPAKRSMSGWRVCRRQKRALLEQLLNGHPAFRLPRRLRDGTKRSASARCPTRSSACGSSNSSRQAVISTTFTVPVDQGGVDHAALARGVTALVERHEMLRTTFPASDGRPRQVVGAAGPVTGAAGGPDGLAARGPDRRGRPARHDRRPPALRPRPRPVVAADAGAPRAHRPPAAGDAASSDLRRLVDGRVLRVSSTPSMPPPSPAGRRPRAAADPIRRLRHVAARDPRRGRRRTALAYWQQQLGAVPTLALPTDRAAPRGAEFRRRPRRRPLAARPHPAPHRPRPRRGRHALHGPRRRPPAPARPLQRPGRCRRLARRSPGAPAPSSKA